MQPAPQQPEFLTLRGVAEDYFGGRVSVEAVRDWVAAGRLKAYRPGGKIILIRRDELESLLAASTEIRYRIPWMDGKRGKRAEPASVS